jgi:cell fate (sporulation/competence/biofilm development) regulator YlbF (YheA/YmcA/DUF963 family)
MYKLSIWAAARWLTDIDLFNLLASSAWSIRTYIKFIDPQYLHMLVNPQDIRYLDLIQLHTKHIKLIYRIGIKRQPIYKSNYYKLEQINKLEYNVSISNPYNLVIDIKSSNLYEHSLDINIYNHTKYKHIPRSMQQSSNSKYLFGDFTNIRITSRTFMIAGPNIIDYIVKNNHIRQLPQFDTGAHELVNRYILNYTLDHGLYKVLLAYSPMTLIRNLIVKAETSIELKDHCNKLLSSELITKFSMDHGSVMELSPIIFDVPNDPYGIKLLRLAITSMDTDQTTFSKLIYLASNFTDLDDIIAPHANIIKSLNIYKHNINNDGTLITCIADLEHYMSNKPVKQAILQFELIVSLNDQTYSQLSENTRYKTLVSMINLNNGDEIYNIINSVRKLDQSRLTSELSAVYSEPNEITYIIGCIYNTPINIKYTANTLAFKLKAWNILMSPSVTINTDAMILLVICCIDIPYKLLDKMKIPQYREPNIYLLNYYNKPLDVNLTASEIVQINIYKHINKVSLHI